MTLCTILHSYNTLALFSLPSSETTKPIKDYDDYFSTTKHRNDTKETIVALISLHFQIILDDTTVNDPIILK